MSAALNRRALISSLISLASGLAVANGSVPSISILISRPERRSRIGTERIWASSSVALENSVAAISSSMPSRAGRTWMSTIGPDVDAFDQGGKEGTLACRGQLGPALPEFLGSRDQTALR